MQVIVVKTQEEGAKAAFEVFKRAYNEGAQSIWVGNWIKSNWVIWNY